MDEKIAPPHLEELTRALGDLEKTGIRQNFISFLLFAFRLRLQRRLYSASLVGKGKS